MKYLVFKRTVALFIFFSFLTLLYFNQHNYFESEYRSQIGGFTGSTCSRKSDLRGSGQKVIAYSIYPNWETGFIHAKYTKLLPRIVKTIGRIYPGWVIRIYHNLSDWQLIQHEVLQEISILAHVDLCNASHVILQRNQTVRFPKTWRYLPAVDDNVDYFLSRDSDSPILQREVDAVADWIRSNVTYHSMRDHPNHCIPFLAGLWGVRLVEPEERSLVQRATAEILFHQEAYIGDVESADQNLLTRYLWLPYKNRTMSHDSYCCSNFPGSRPFPTRREGSYFVGKSLDPDNQEPPRNMDPCPQHCRPKDRQDWLYC